MTYNLFSRTLNPTHFTLWMKFEMFELTLKFLHGKFHFCLCMVQVHYPEKCKFVHNCVSLQW